MRSRKTKESSSEQPSIAEVLAKVDTAETELIAITRALVRIPSETPPSDTREVAKAVASMLETEANVTTTFYPSEVPVENLVAVADTGRKGRSLVFNGHLDTYPIGDPESWSDDPFSGMVRDGKIFGRGSVDMKGGIACALMAFKLLTRNRHLWSGQLVLALAGDEESMGTLGSQYLLDNVPDARGDAMLCADVGSPLVPRIGEKGMIWIDIHADGNPAHGAHVHRGRNAIDLLVQAMNAISELRNFNVDTPSDVAAVIDQAKAISEPLGGDGEADVLQHITVNFGRISGGTSANLVADKAEVNADIRLPLGVSVSEAEGEISRILAGFDHIKFEIVRRYEPNWTDPNEHIVRSVATACREVLEQEPVVNMRVGASDARLYRAAGIPTVVCGLTPHNLGGPDEFVGIDEMVTLTKIHVLAALKFLEEPIH